ncbi:MAG: DUF3048 domain-containing protein [Oscillospiraceae bacterium]|nr:DUF3048 domain-containing protein [Oscillospiraceae bacterium]
MPFNKIRAVVPLVLIAAVIVSACAYAVPISPRAQTSGSGFSLFNDNPVPFGKSPTTGLDWTGEYKPVLVQVNNYLPSRPHWNLSAADIVYETINGGYGNSNDRRYVTRYTAVYNDNRPTLVGAVRSARVHHLSLREEWDCPIVHFGGNDWYADSAKKNPLPTNILAFFRQQNVSTSDPKDFSIDGANDGHDYNGSNNDFTQQLTRWTQSGEPREADHNAVANVELIVNEYYPEDYAPRNHAFSFTDTPPTGFDSAIALSIEYGEDYLPSYTYNEATRTYERSYCGEAQYDGYSKERLVASNVIVQRATTTFYNGMSDGVLIDLVGEGDADIFVGGRHIPAKWIRKNLADRTVFVDQMGVEIPLLPGKTFVQIIANTMNYTYTRADGSVITQTPDSNKITEMENMEFDPESEERVRTESD